MLLHGCSLERAVKAMKGEVGTNVHIRIGTLTRLPYMQSYVSSNECFHKEAFASLIE